MSEPAATPRKVGFEIEFAGTDAPGAARILARALGGTVEVETPHHPRVTGSRLGGAAHAHFAPPGLVTGALAPDLRRK